jgi:hypothetical protein
LLFRREKEMAYFVARQDRPVSWSIKNINSIFPFPERLPLLLQCGFKLMESVE